jgi:hypothetical protein
LSFPENGTGLVDAGAWRFRRYEMSSKNTICLWYDGDALDAATFCQDLPDSAVGAVFHLATIPMASRAMS